MKATIVCIILALSVFLVSATQRGHPFPTRPVSRVGDAKDWKLLQFSPTHSEWIHKHEIREILFNSYKKNSTFANSFERRASQKAIEVLRGAHKKGRYIDVTDEYNEGIRYFVLPTLEEVAAATPEYPTPSPSSHPEILDLFKQVSTSTLQQNMKDLTSLRTRYYLSDYSAQSPNLVKSKVDALIKASGRTDVKSDFIKNSDYDQPNVRVIIPAKDGSTKAQQVVILGSHLDSIVVADDTNENSRSPGADDDASGTVTVLEVLRLVLASNWRGSRPIHFMWFAAEEAGLLGSKTVAKKYKNDGVNVHGMLQLDMTGYMPGGPSITSLTDPNSQVAKYLGKVAKAYIPNVPLVMDSCGYACSDQWSFYRQGYPAGMYIEAEPTDPYIHTVDDTMDRLDFDGMAEFVRVSLAFITEIAR